LTSRTKGREHGRDLPANCRLGEKYQADKIVLFGSRARGDNRERSDIDIAVYGMPPEKQGLFWSAIDDLPSLLNVDIVHITDRTDAALLNNIKRDGVTIMNKAEEKYGKLTQAVSLPGSIAQESRFGAYSRLNRRSVEYNPDYHIKNIQKYAKPPSVSLGRRFCFHRVPMAHAIPVSSK
jgi:predicted nucleotidyltransferase